MWGNVQGSRMFLGTSQWYRKSVCLFSREHNMMSDKLKQHILIIHIDP